MRGSRDLIITAIDGEAVKPPTAVERTLAAIGGKWAGNDGRINQARALIKRAKKSDARRRMEKATRKANRRRR